MPAPVDALLILILPKMMTWADCTDQDRIPRDADEFGRSDDRISIEVSEYCMYSGSVVKFISGINSEC